jgi:hypothetical protein
VAWPPLVNQSVFKAYEESHWVMVSKCWMITGKKYLTIATFANKYEYKFRRSIFQKSKYFQFGELLLKSTIQILYTNVTTLEFTTTTPRCNRLERFSHQKKIFLNIGTQSATRGCVNFYNSCKNEVVGLCNITTLRL